MSRTLIIDRVMPEWDVEAAHETLVNAPPARTFEAITTADLAPVLVRILLALRGLPSALIHRRTPGPGLLARWREPMTLGSFEQAGFRILETSPPHEIVVGLVGRFWTLTGDLRPADLATFMAPPTPGTVRAVWNFHVSSAGSGSRLTTTTRVQAADDPSRRAFLRYWRVVGPFSAFTRRKMLAAISREATAPMP